MDRLDGTGQTRDPVLGTADQCSKFQRVIHIHSPKETLNSKHACIYTAIQLQVAACAGHPACKETVPLGDDLNKRQDLQSIDLALALFHSYILHRNLLGH